MPDGEIERLDNLNAELDRCEQVIDLAERMDRLNKNPDFIAVFEEHYVASFSATVGINFDGYSPETQSRVVSKLRARSAFVIFHKGLIDAGNAAFADRIELQNAIDAGDDSEEHY